MTTTRNHHVEESFDSVDSKNLNAIIQEEESSTVLFHHHVSNQPWNKYVRESAFPHCTACKNGTTTMSLGFEATNEQNHSCEFCGTPNVKSPSRYCSKLPSLSEIFEDR